MGIQDVIGRVPMFGGSAADENVEGNWKIICNDKVFKGVMGVNNSLTSKDKVSADDLFVDFGCKSKL